METRVDTHLVISQDNNTPGIQAALQLPHLVKQAGDLSGFSPADLRGRDSRGIVLHHLVRGYAENDAFLSMYRRSSLIDAQIMLLRNDTVSVRIQFKRRRWVFFWDTVGLLTVEYDLNTGNILQIIW